MHGGTATRCFRHVRRPAVIITHNRNVALCCGTEPETDERASGNATNAPMCFTRAQLQQGHMKPPLYLSSATAHESHRNLHYPNEPKRANHRAALTHSRSGARSLHTHQHTAHTLQERGCESLL